jgi:broad specificity phosphatase PhoE
MTVRRRIYLLRHADVSYVDEAGRLVRPAEAVLTARGQAQARTLADLFKPVRFDRAITSGLQRTLDTARRILEGRQDSPAIEEWPELAEVRSGRLSDIAPGALEAAFLGAFRGVTPESARFLGGESIGEVFDRVLPALQRLLDNAGWDCALLVLHGGVNRAILSYALTGGRTFLGHIEQAPACVNVLDIGDAWVVRAVNLRADDPLHLEGRETTMEKLLEQIRPLLPR